MKLLNGLTSLRKKEKMINYNLQIILAIVLSIIVGYQWGKLNTLEFISSYKILT